MGRRPQRVVLAGFMGAGKTTVARELARRRGCGCVDLDEFITTREGRAPRRLIDEEGEDYFREVETRALRDVLEGDAARVIALGGGAWAFERNRALVAEHGCFAVWLDAPFELCWQRITGGDWQDRPLARDRERARRLYEERRAAYERAALRVAVGANTSAAEIAESIETALLDTGVAT